MADGRDYSAINERHVGAETDTFTVERYQQFGRWLPPGTVDVLDVGCSTGRGGVVLAEDREGIRLVGLDCVAARIEKLPSAYSDGLVGVPTDVPAADASFDAVVAGEFIEHLRPEDVEASLIEFSRVLRSGGVLLLTTPNPGYLRLTFAGRTVVGGAHLSEHMPRDLAGRVARVGFSDVRVSGSGKVSRLLGSHWPMPFYGSYLLRAVRSPR